MRKICRVKLAIAAYLSIVCLMSQTLHAQLTPELSSELSDLQCEEDTLPVVKRARLVFGGDLMQHTPQIKAARNSDGGIDYSASFQYVKPLFEQADLSIVNLETTLTASKQYTGYPMFRSPQELAGALRDIGIDAVVLANNHILDGGKKGVFTTLATLDSVGIKHTGIFTDSRGFVDNHPMLLQANGLRIALLNYTYGTNGLATPDGLYVNRIDTFRIAHDIGHIDRSLIDVVIVYFHWGAEYARQPNNEQKRLTELCRKYGADIVIGSHPHVIQPVTIEKDTAGNICSLTAYSLGNLASNQRERYTDGGLILSLDVVKERDRLTISPSYTPVWVRLPSYTILPPPVADTIGLTTTERATYERFMEDVKGLFELSAEGN